MLDLKTLSDEALNLLAESIQDELDNRRKNKYEELFNNFKEALLALQTNFPSYHASSYADDNWDWDDICRIFFKFDC